MTREQLNRAELLETLTVCVTAFRNWGEFKAAMVGGYVPTLRTKKLAKNASRQSKQDNHAVEVLAAMVREEGFRTFGNC